MTCPRCNRLAVGWPLKRADVCSPAGWKNCLREPSAIIKAGEGESGSTCAGIFEPAPKPLVTRGPIPQWERRSKVRPEPTLTLEQEIEEVSRG